MASNYKKGYAQLENKTIRFGGPLSKPENIFTAKLHKVPSYTISYLENYGSGGWIEGSHIVTKNITDTYLVIKNDVCIGVIFEPYVSHLNISTAVYPIGIYPNKHLSGKEIIEKEIALYSI